MAGIEEQSIDSPPVIDAVDPREGIRQSLTELSEHDSIDYELSE
jgi:hypothetical protein